MPTGAGIGQGPDDLARSHADEPRDAAARALWGSANEARLTAHEAGRGEPPHHANTVQVEMRRQRLARSNVRNRTVRPDLMRNTGSRMDPA